MIYSLTVNQNSNKRVISVSDNLTLRESLIKENLIFDAPCGGKGSCGKCKARIIFSEQEIDSKDGYILLCKTYPICNMEIEIEEQKEEIDFISETQNQTSNLVCDIGTTTVVISFFDESGVLCAKSTFLNPQKIFGADVISRIKSCNNFGTIKVRELLILKIEKLIERYKSKTNTKSIEKALIVSNTVMSHIFAGISPQSMANSPYKTVFTDKKVLHGREIGLSINPIVLLPSVSAFLGSDFLVGLSYVNTISPKKPYLYLDLGTNGEIALFDGNKIYATSCAVGPAFEGGNIGCGIGGVSGAIVSVNDYEENVNFETIGNLPPIGICGSGLISLISYLKDSFILSSQGTFTNGLDKYEITENVYLTQNDVRQFQLAKSAIRTGIETLIAQNNITVDAIETVYIAGGLGQYVDIYALFNLGILPKELRNKCKRVGNSALLGAENLLLNEKLTYLIEKIKSKIVTINLAVDKEFNAKFNKYIDLV